MKRLAGLAALAAVLGAMLGGCVVVPDGGYYGGYYGGYHHYHRGYYDRD